MSVGDPAVKRQLPFGFETMVSGGIKMNGLSKCKAYPRLGSNLRVKVNSVLWVQNGNLIHSICDEVQRLTQNMSRNFACRKCKENIGKQWSKKKSYVMTWQQ